MPSAASKRFRAHKYLPRSPFGHRQISAVLRRAEPCQRPDCIPIGRPRGAKRLGITFERAIAKAVPLARRGQWFYFEDFYGPGYCQTDFLLFTPSAIFVIEAKLTDTPAAQAQLRELYLPVVTKAYGLPALGIVLVKNLSPETARGAICDSLAMAFAMAAHTIPTLHWLGHGPL